MSVRRRSRSGRRREGEKNDATEKETQSMLGKRTRRRARRDKEKKYGEDKSGVHGRYIKIIPQAKTPQNPVKI